jgi:hypothetical protein
VAAAIAVLALEAGPAAATFPGRDGLIGWSYMFNFNEGPTPPEWGVRTVKDSGRAGRNLRICDTFGYCEQWADPAYSPSGRELAWDIQTEHAGPRVVIADADGSHAVPIGLGFDPSFSPSGRRVIDVRPHGRIDQIVTSNLVGGDVRELLGVSRAPATRRSHPTGIGSCSRAARRSGS